MKFIDLEGKQKQMETENVCYFIIMKKEPFIWMLGEPFFFLVVPSYKQENKLALCNQVKIQSMSRKN